MADKKWDQMNHDEKLEALRKDIQLITDFTNGMSRDIRQLDARQNKAEAQLDALRKKVASVTPKA